MTKKRICGKPFDQYDSHSWHYRARQGHESLHITILREGQYDCICLIQIDATDTRWRECGSMAEARGQWPGEALRRAWRLLHPRQSVRWGFAGA